MSELFENYLNDMDCYISLESHFFGFFQGLICRLKIDEGRVKFPFYKTCFSNGVPFFDGNPIFSAKDNQSGKILRVVLDDEVDRLKYFNDKDGGCEFVIVGSIMMLSLIEKEIANWVKGI